MLDDSDEEKVTPGNWHFFTLDCLHIQYWQGKIKLGKQFLWSWTVCS